MPCKDKTVEELRREFVKIAKFQKTLVCSAVNLESAEQPDTSRWKEIINLYPCHTEVMLRYTYLVKLLLRYRRKFFV